MVCGEGQYSACGPCAGLTQTSFIWGLRCSVEQLQNMFAAHGKQTVTILMISWKLTAQCIDVGHSRANLSKT